MGSNIMKWIILGVSPILLLELTLSEIQLFKNDDELQKFHESKLLQSWSNVQKSDLETSLVKLNSRLGRSTQFDLIQYDSEESAEVFQVRNLSRSKRSRRKRSPERRSQKRKSPRKRKRRRRKRRSLVSQKAAAAAKKIVQKKNQLQQLPQPLLPQLQQPQLRQQQLQQQQLLHQLLHHLMEDQLKTFNLY